MAGAIKKCSDDGLREIQEEFKRRYKKQWLLLGGLAASLAYIFTAVWIIAEHGIILNDYFFYALVLIVVVPFAWQGITNWKCPACNENLGQYSVYPKRCDSCGVPFTDDSKQ